jgi:hypothetical protein
MLPTEVNGSTSHEIRFSGPQFWNKRSFRVFYRCGRLRTLRSTKRSNRFCGKNSPTPTGVRSWANKPEAKEPGAILVQNIDCWDARQTTDPIRSTRDLPVTGEHYRCRLCQPIHVLLAGRVARYLQHEGSLYSLPFSEQSEAQR